VVVVDQAHAGRATVARAGIASPWSSGCVVDTEAWPAVLPPGSHYLLAFGGSRVVLGATRETGSGFDYRVTAAGQAEVLNQTLTVASRLGPATLVETRIGFRPVEPDLKPMLGRIVGLDGLVIGNGLGPSGLTIGPFAGRVLAQLMLGAGTRPHGVQSAAADRWGHGWRSRRDSLAWQAGCALAGQEAALAYAEAMSAVVASVRLQQVACRYS
jgi:glycine/D-amino acid oxidase-like deaminating enzyme